MEAVGGGIEPAVHRLRAGLEEVRKLVLRCAFRETFLQNTAFIQ